MSHPIIMNAFTKQILLATCLIAAPTCVYAAPFNPNPTSFLQYMNSVRWKDGSKVYFQNLHDCVINPDIPVHWYFCNRGYATITNPMGTKVCSLTDISWRNILGTGVVNYTTGSCRYK
jgi:hypothetical protein